MNKQKIYISGGISGYDIEERRATFAKIEEQFVKQGYDVVNPLKNGVPVNASWDKHLRKDIATLVECDAIYMLKDWHKSKGAKLEFDIAIQLGMEIIFEMYRENV